MELVEGYQTAREVLRSSQPPTRDRTPKEEKKERQQKDNTRGGLELSQIYPYQYSLPLFAKLWSGMQEKPKEYRKACRPRPIVLVPKQDDLTKTRLPTQTDASETGVEAVFSQLQEGQGLPTEMPMPYPEVMLCGASSRLELRGKVCGSRLEATRGLVIDGRYLHTLYLGVQSRWRGEHERQHFYWRMMFESADISMLRLLETFLKSAPQLVLQLSIMIHSNQVQPLQGLSASASLVSLAWMLASYQKVLRDSRDDKPSMSYKAVLVQMLWHLFTIGARTLAFALFASVFELYFTIFIVTHWCVMTFWIIQGETDFCMSKWEEIIYNMMVGIIYIFCWFNVKEGGARCRLLAYCVLTLVENAGLTVLWFLHREAHTSDFCALVLVCVMVCSYAFGSFFMFVYYCLLHPNGAISAGQWGGCVEDGGAGPLSSPATAAPVHDVVTSPPCTLQRTTGAERDREVGEVFQVRPCTPPTPEPHPRRTEGPVIRIDLPRKHYPAWDAHFIDRRLRKTVLVLEATSPATPRLQYRSLGAAKEVLEYETTV
ncbi:hypothetical protein AAFF_G00145580 [Aldrovandia affinis]|uniref:XK-related protein n=1 Tax=Aldrovandia affinis TaxID=143900 RepID=A0AAD7T0R2_9TELE|nr:hypothetical protein AAFF_G00145580 [Aldrovandia affinis]